MIQSGPMADTSGSGVRRQPPAGIVAGTLLAVSIVACALDPLSGASGPSTAPAPAIMLPTAIPTASLPAPAPTSTADVQAEMDGLEHQIVQLRGLQPTSPVHRLLLPESQVRARLAEDLLTASTSEPGQGDATVFALLGLLPSGFDLRRAYVDLSAGQPADFYEHKSRVMVVVSDRGFGIVERLAYIRAYDFALQDQHFGLAGRLGYDPAACPCIDESSAAVRALIEGDAALLQEQWLRTYATLQDLTDLALSERGPAGPANAVVPLFVLQAVGFPKTLGLEFVRRLYLKGGWAAVDAAYANPPASTEQILHPERYPKAAPVAIDAPYLSVALGSGWHEVGHGVLGEWNTRALLETEVPQPEAEAAAFGWGGDAYRVYQTATSGESVLVWIASWDGLHDAGEFASAFQKYADARFGPRQSIPPSLVWSNGQAYVTFEAASDQTLWILAPDAATAGAVRHAVRFPVLHP